MKDQRSQASLSRRRFLKRSAMAVAAAAGGSLFYTWRIEPRWIEVVERSLQLAGLPTAWAGRRIVHISDLHSGPQVEAPYLHRAFDMVRDLAPDLVVITGDFTTFAGSSCVENVARVFERFTPGRLGSLAVLGNHDYGRGFSDGPVADELIRRLQQHGVEFLRNRIAFVEGLGVAGVDDLWAGRLNLPSTFGSVDASGVHLALCHNPDAADLGGWGSFRGMILSGHTHGGQCKAPFLPPPLLPVKNRRYTSGEFALTGGRHLYINRGLGHLQRVRFLARPEITVFELSAA